MDAAVVDAAAAAVAAADVAGAAAAAVAAAAVAAARHGDVAASARANTNKSSGQHRATGRSPTVLAVPTERGAISIRPNA